ncbi:hypothetical protein A3K29_05625 [Candidatus Collierbacteria bacterium RIFOXYB2_FULL_46_14]|uniref:Uncharacterized protein n=1 Tax=Candidatus Collierbacteria bacterium GW2011_GWA2_46_26 TaxID=1618381 RepID=A0A0G1RRQ4_9BACT|nr:MAG: hypothetical protein UX47_C0009G0035 [Candidatus Collierbacteria bacterium GW2011_GWA2_46_26]OGD73568.1 MAG: hypothetical protein A3K29_05625 [Candidatus Collierbacteria bacterium RIFOXYB2_FULL_46_14]OGD76610.1 MAG: hypothetical protein A3K43_05625 [Candidatus Collierbacteria bacterium RIFOXYA2_FULL_46_20]OGD77946.1 MAG: hypothetical protein A3K39_05625 [Candidatus Collierbacteria bacterium RIFOXYC2_FULL_43_15]OGD79970.1 MAG: hypothetical protein A2320_00055 [Pseudomonadales bacterium G
MKLTRIIVALSAFAILIFSSLRHATQTNSANLGVVKDTLQTSRLSFAGRVKAPTIAGSSHVWIYTASAAEFYSVSTAGLKVGDALTIGTGSYTIDSIVDADEFTLTANLSSGDADDTDVIYLKSKPQHVITFTTASSIASGFFRVLIPAATSNFNDVAPDSTGFDFNTAVSATASNVSGYTFVTPVATVSGGTNCPSGWHCFEFHYTGTGGVGTAVTLNIGATDGTNTPIAPAPKSGHAEGTADTYSFRVQNFVNASDPTGTPTDQSTGKIGVIESVRVTATVDPTISFSIAGVASGANPCGSGTPNQTDVTTVTGVNAPLAVPFGTLTLNTFMDAAHLLTVSTNATNGYIVTAQENDQLGKDGGTTPFIVDADGDNGTANETTSDTWDTATGNPGFGYTLKSVAGASVPFTTTGGTFNVRAFPSIADPDSPLVQNIMSNTTVANSDQINVCYRVSVAATQAAGDYENQITYTATASF